MNQGIRVSIGIDGGGSTCRGALLFAAGGPRIEACAGPSNVRQFDQALASIDKVFQQLIAEAGLSDEVLASTSVHLGLAGVLSSADVDRTIDAIESIYEFGSVTVSDDQVTTLSGALGGGDGVVVAVGTGSFVGRKSTAVRFVGGWGLSVGDQSSGAYLGRRLLQECLLAHDGIRGQTDLTSRIMESYGGTPANIVAFAQSATPAEYARLAPLVFSSAVDLDDVAVDVVTEGAAYLSQAILALGWRASEPICLLGGVGPRYRDWLPKDMADAVVDAQGTSLDGALLIASEGWSHD